MQQILAIWNESSGQRKIKAGLATLALIVSVGAIANMATKTQMALLYSGLDQQASGEVLSTLDAQSAAYEVRGGSIYVDSGRRDLLRMQLASQGLPRNGSAGYELLDSLNGFGTTSQMFDAAYWRAKEGELVRTISASPHIRSARVHIANQKSSSFSRANKGSASVTVSSANGALAPSQAKAIQYLVSSAITGLAPADVAIIDETYGLIDASNDNSIVGASSNNSSEAMREKVLRILEARVGRGNAKVEISVEAVTESESIREVTIDPESRVAISTTVEESTNSQSGASGQVTVASNLPDGDGANGQNSSQNSQTREQTNFEVSEVQREILRAPGAIKRLTVAVLVNSVSTLAEDGTPSITQRTEEELADLKSLVEASVGFSAERGDLITLKSLDFEPKPDLAAPFEPSLFDVSGLDVMSLIKLSALTAVTLFVGLFILRPLMKPVQPPLLSDDVPQIGPSLDAEVVSLDTETAGELIEAEKPVPLDPIERLRSMIEERQEETIAVLKTWVAKDEKELS